MHPFARGIYITLLCHQWSHGPLSLDNSRQLSQITGAMPDELDEHLDEVRSKFKECDDGLFVNVRLATEFDKKNRAHQRAVDNANKRWKKDASADANPCATDDATAHATDDATAHATDDATAHATDDATAHATDDAKGMLFKEVGRRKKEVSKKKNDAFDPLSVELPFDSPEFTEAWQSWVTHRIEKKKWLTGETVKLQLKKFTEMGEQSSVKAIAHSIEKGWVGIFWPDPEQRSRAGPGTFAQQKLANTSGAVSSWRPPEIQNGNNDERCE